MKKTYAVFGLGRYGTAVAEELVANGAEVLAVDVTMSVVNEASTRLPVCKCADITDKKVIQQLGISNIDTVIIAMASSVEASVMATILCKEVGVSTVIVKCANEIHRKIYEKVGADKVIFPENESGMRLAKNLVTSGFIDMVELTADVSVAEIDVKPEWVGKSLAELNFRKKYNLNVVAVRFGAEVDTLIDPSAPLNSGMKLIIIADTATISRMK